LPVIIAIFVVWLLVQYWYVVVGLAALGAVGWLIWNNPHDPPSKLSTYEKTVAYIIIKDGLGKFGITKKRSGGERYSVNKRYKNQRLRILWTSTLPCRGDGYEFEKYCKTRVGAILKGREWFDQRLANKLVKDVKKAGY
jgi:hypothetical protein